MSGPSGFVVVWGCFCSDAADDPAALAAFCPGHGRARLGDVIENERDGPVTHGHACREATCSSVVYHQHNQEQPT